jgi:hypothetical protein
LHHIRASGPVTPHRWRRALRVLAIFAVAAALTFAALMLFSLTTLTPVVRLVVLPVTGPTACLCFSTSRIPDLPVPARQV